MKIIKAILAFIIKWVKKNFTKQNCCKCVIIFSIALSQKSFAQTNSCYVGVYLTYSDFVKNKLSFKVDIDRKGNSFGFLLLTHTIKIVKPDTTIQFKIGSIWGYNDCRSVYRYSPDVELYSPEDYYKIEETGGDSLLTIYSSVFKGGTEYFFSTGLNMPIHRLSMSHLEKDFGGLFPKFIEEVKKMKSENEGDLSVRDSHGSFLINKLYQQYLTK